MLKLLNKQTNNVFTLPDEEALKIKSNDRACIFEILDCGKQEQTQETVTDEEAKELIEEKKSEDKSLKNTTRKLPLKSTKSSTTTRRKSTKG